MHAAAVGNALGGLVTEYDLNNTVRINGRTASSTDRFTINGDNIPAQSDSDSESVAEALERIDTSVAGVSGDLSDEIDDREDADDALDGRITTIEGWDAADLPVDNTESPTRSVQSAITGLETRAGALEQKLGFSVTVAFTVVENTSQTITDDRITADYDLTGFQFFDSTDAETAVILADFSWETSTGALTVVFDSVRASGSVRLSFGWREEVTVE